MISRIGKIDCKQQHIVILMSLSLDSLTHSEHAQTAHKMQSFYRALHNGFAKLGGLICHIRQKNSKFFVAGCLRLFPCSNHSENLINRKISIFCFDTILRFIFQLQEKIFFEDLENCYFFLSKIFTI